MNDPQIKKICLSGKRSYILRKDGEVTVFGEEEHAKVLVKDKDIVDLCCGQTHLLIIKNDSTILAYGSNSHSNVKVFSLVFKSQILFEKKDNLESPKTKRTQISHYFS